MLNEKAVLLLEQILKNNLKDLSLDKKYFDENDFFY